MVKKIKYPSFRKNRTDRFRRCEKILADLQRLFPEMQVDWQQMIRWLAICRRVYEA